MLILIRQGKVSKWFSGIGQEAISVGITAVLDKDEYILPCTETWVFLQVETFRCTDYFLNGKAKPSGFTKGSDRSFHFGTQEYKIIGMISHLGPQLGVADGIALANKLKKNGKVTAVFTGEGATSEGDFHEALNIASVWDLPVLFVIENNGYGLSTPTNEQYRCENLADKGIGYGMESHIIDGNNILEVYTELSVISSLRCVNQSTSGFAGVSKPSECVGMKRRVAPNTFRKNLMDEWAQERPGRELPQLFKRNRSAH
jgi:2-oxoisovalerate dehydrogenase E1 component